MQGGVFAQSRSSRSSRAAAGAAATTTAPCRQKRAATPLLEKKKKRRRGPFRLFLAFVLVFVLPKRGATFAPLILPKSGAAAAAAAAAGPARFLAEQRRSGVHGRPPFWLLQIKTTAPPIGTGRPAVFSLSLIRPRLLWTTVIFYVIRSTVIFCVICRRLRGQKSAGFRCFQHHGVQVHGRPPFLPLLLLLLLLLLASPPPPVMRRRRRRH